MPSVSVYFDEELYLKWLTMDKGVRSDLLSNLLRGFFERLPENFTGSEAVKLSELIKNEILRGVARNE